MGFRTLHELGHDEKSVQLIDTADTVNVLHNIHLQDTNVVLVPQPSNDVNDPLRWPTWKKYCAFLNICFFAFMVTGFVGGFNPALYTLGIEFKKDLSTTTGLVLWCLLVSGIGNFFWVPIAEYFGKRPVFVVSSLIFFVCTIWCAVSKTFESLLASRIVAAFAGASTEALGAAIVNDIFYLHERGSKMGIYIMFIYSGNSIGPLIGGYVEQGVGWRWYSWLCAILAGLNFAAIFLYVHETRFNRTVNEAIPVLDSAPPIPKAEYPDKDASAQAIESVPSISMSSTDIGRKRTFVENLSLWSGTSKASFLSNILRPWALAIYPAVLWGTIMYSLCLAWQIGCGTLTSFVFQAPPYNFSSGINGLINIPSFLGNLFGAFTGGYLTDVYVRYTARRANGVFSPESRLTLLIIPALLVPAGLLMFGFGAERKLAWILPYVGYGLLNVVTAVASISMTYVMDSYFEVAAEALLLINGGSKLVAWAFTYGFVPWTTSAGYESVFGTMAAIFVGWILLAVPMYVSGARMRDYTTTRMRIIFW